MRITKAGVTQRATQLQHLVGVAEANPAGAVVPGPTQFPSTTASAVAPATDGMCPPTSNVVLIGSSIAVDRDHLVDQPAAGSTADSSRAGGKSNDRSRSSEDSPLEERGTGGSS